MKRVEHYVNQWYEALNSYIVFSGSKKRWQCYHVNKFVFKKYGYDDFNYRKNWGLVKYKDCHYFHTHVNDLMIYTRKEARNR